MEQSAVPTKANLIAAKNTLRTARLGYELMDRKRNVLIREIMELNSRAKSIQERIDRTFAEAYAAIQRANIDMGISNTWRTGLNVETDGGVKIRERSVMGVLIPIVLLEPRDDALPPFALSNTTSSLDVALVKFKTVKSLVIELSMIENSAYRLAVGIKKAQKRANALKNLTIPRLEELVKNISETLEERERDDFSRLKVVKGKK